MTPQRIKDLSYELFTRLKGQTHDVVDYATIERFMVMAVEFGKSVPPPADETWQPIETAPKGKKVLVSWLNSHGHRRMTCAIYYEAGDIQMDDDVPEEDVDENGNNAEGSWFEDCASKEPSYWPIGYPLTHWRVLPTFNALPSAPAKDTK